VAIEVLTMKWRKIKFNKKVLTAISMMLFSSTTLADNAVVNFDVNANAKQTFMGFGSMLWAGANSTNLLAMHQNSNLTMVRTNYELRNANVNTSTVPNNLTYAQYLNGWTAIAGTNPVQYKDGWVNSSDKPVDMQIPNMKYMWLPSIPNSMLSNNTLVSSKRDAFVLYLAAGIKHLSGRLCNGTLSNCYKLDYVEISNEPDYYPIINKADYVYIIKTLRAYMNTNNISPTTQIVGSGAAHIDGGKLSGCSSCWGPGTDALNKAVIADTAAKNALGAWSIHSYVWAQKSVCGSFIKSPCGGSIENAEATSAINGYGNTAVRYFFPSWYASPKSAAPTKPVIVSELGTGTTVFHGVTYAGADQSKLCVAADRSDCTVVYTVPYGVRLYNNAISLLAGGANAAMVWEGQDQNWYTSGLGLLNRNGVYKPNYYAMKPLFSTIPLNAQVLVSPSTQAGDDIYSVGFKSVNSLGETCVSVAMVNAATVPLTRITIMTGLTGKNLSAVTPVVATQFSQAGATVYDYAVTNPTVAISKTSDGVFNYSATMPNDSTLTVQACFQ
jgi:hypothetical protein